MQDSSHFPKVTAILLILKSIFIEGISIYNFQLNDLSSEQIPRRQ